MTHEQKLQLLIDSPEGWELQEEGSWGAEAFHRDTGVRVVVSKVIDYDTGVTDRSGTEFSLSRPTRRRINKLLKTLKKKKERSHVLKEWGR